MAGEGGGGVHGGLGGGAPPAGGVEVVLHLPGGGVGLLEPAEYGLLVAELGYGGVGAVGHQLGVGVAQHYEVEGQLEEGGVHVVIL